MQCTELADLFNELKDNSLGISEFYAKQSEIIKQRFCDFFKYYKDELESLRAVKMIFHQIGY